MQAATGYVMLKAVLDDVGPEALSAALHEILTTSRSGKEILDLILAHVPADGQERVKGIFARWVNGY